MNLNLIHRLAFTLFLSQSTCFAQHPVRRLSTKNGKKAKVGRLSTIPYEVWAADQSNSVADADGIGITGSFLWIWDSSDITDQLDEGTEALPLSCTPFDEHGPCNLLDIFPSNLKANTCSGDLCSESGETLDHDNGHFGRLHAVMKDPQNKYVTANIFTPKGGYLGIIDTETKEAIALFRVTAMVAGSHRSVHISHWSEDGNHILISNLHGKMIQRIDITRNTNGSIEDLHLNKSATIFLGRGFEVKEDEDALFYSGDNAFDNPLKGTISGSYDDADTSDLTPLGTCKESECSGFSQVMEGGSRPNNVPICAVTTKNDRAYVTFGGGGLFILDLKATPMKIIAEYGNAVVNGAGLCGAHSDDKIFLNGGISAGGAGFDQSTSTLYAFNDSLLQYDPDHSYDKQNMPMPDQVFKDPTNTNTIGNVDGASDKNESGQLPGKSTRRDSHGIKTTKKGTYIHMSDRIQNVMDVFDTETYEHVGTYDLVSKDGKSGRGGASGPCRNKSVLDDPLLQLNDPAPDLFDITPDGKYFMVAFRGPVPVTVPHAAQGSCPGVGIVEITDGGKSGKLVDILRTVNTLDKVENGEDRTVGGHHYKGAERSDVHYSIVVYK